jgi:hypothetical protein
MQDFAVLLAVIAALSLTATKIVDLIRNVPMFKDRWIGSWVWNVVALVVGLAMCLGWEINLAESAAKLVPALTDQVEKFSGTTGQFLTGLVVGGGSGFFHELLDALSGVASRDHAEAAVEIVEPHG